MNRKVESIHECVCLYYFATEITTTLATFYVRSAPINTANSANTANTNKHDFIC